MKLSKQEKAARRAAFRAMSLKKKLEHVYTYYKWPILLGLLALAVLGSALRRELTSREPVLYAALLNVAVGEDLERALDAGYLEAVGVDPERREVYLYPGLYLSEDADTTNHEYAYASRMKLFGAVNAERMDLVLTNREGYDLLSRNGYLLELPPLLAEGDPALAARLRPCLRENELVLSDNAIEYQLGEAAERETVTETQVNALDVSEFALFARAGFPEPVYLGVVANSPRLPAVLAYIAYLSSAEAD